MDCVADADEKLKPLAHGEFLRIAKLGELGSAHQFHDEIRPSRGRHPGVENAGNVRVVHHRERLSLLIKAGDHFLGIHSQFDDFERDTSPDRLVLLDHPDGAETAVPYFLKEFVLPDEVADVFWFEAFNFCLNLRGDGRVHKALRVVGVEQLLDSCADRVVITCRVKVVIPFARWHRSSKLENLLFGHNRYVGHGSNRAHTYTCGKNREIVSFPPKIF